MVRSVLENREGTRLTYLTFLKMTQGTVLLEFCSKIAMTHFVLNTAHYPHFWQLNLLDQALVT